MLRGCAAEKGLFGIEFDPISFFAAAFRPGTVAASLELGGRAFERVFRLGIVQRYYALHIRFARDGFYRDLVSRRAFQIDKMCIRDRLEGYPLEIGL